MNFKLLSISKPKYLQQATIHHIVKKNIRLQKKNLSLNSKTSQLIIKFLMIIIMKLKRKTNVKDWCSSAIPWSGLPTQYLGRQYGNKAIAQKKIEEHMWFCMLIMVNLDYQNIQVYFWKRITVYKKIWENHCITPSKISRDTQTQNYG